MYPRLSDGPGEEFRPPMMQDDNDDSLDSGGVGKVTIGWPEKT